MQRVLLIIFTFFFVGCGIVGFVYENDDNFLADISLTTINNRRYDIETEISGDDYTIAQITNDTYIFPELKHHFLY